MSYSDFSLPEVIKRFDLELHEVSALFGSLAAIAVPQSLQQALTEQVPLALAMNTEKARSELMIMPVLLVVRKLVQPHFSLFSGIDFNIEPSQGLNGVCDYLISRSSEQLFAKAPIITVVEAKNENIKSGLGQCIAEMLAAQIFNQRENATTPTIYGVVTSGNLWRFLKLEGKVVFIDLRDYHIDQIGVLLAVFKEILQ
jgi:hypothetical protein